MARKPKVKIEALFTPHLQEGEEIRWISEPARNIWRLNFNPILNRLVNFVAFILYIPYIILMLLILPILIFLAPIGLVYFNFQLLVVSQMVFLILLSPIIGGCLALGFMLFSYKINIEIPKIRLHFASITLPLHGHNYYAITNQRVMISERGNIHDYSLLLMADAAIGKPNAGASIIHIYNSTNPTGQLPEPVFELVDIEEEEAQAAYEILRQAREEALEDRAREMGIE